MNAESIRLAARTAEERRARIDAMLAELQHRLDPQLLKSQATEAVRDSGSRLARGARRTVERQPVAVAAGAGMLVLLAAWKPMRALIRRRRARKAQRPDLVTSRRLISDERTDDYEAALRSPLAQEQALDELPPGLPH